MFENIAGYQDVKEELNRIRDWVLRREEITSKGAKLPRGIVFYGKPGNGKTLFLREFANSFDYPTITIESEGGDASKRIREAFLASKSNPFTIILIDEIDLLLSGKEDERALRLELDGVDSNPNVLVLATTNRISSLGDALRRSGRFDRTIFIGSPDRESREHLLRFYANKLGLSEEVDFAYLSRVIPSVSCADIASIVNDVFLRCGEKASTHDFEVSHKRVFEGDFSLRSSFDPSRASPEIAYHEVAHALLMHKYSEYFIFYEAKYKEGYQSGQTTWFPTDERPKTSDYFLKDIEVSIAGHVMTKLKFHRLDAGCIDDLQNCRDNATRLVNKLGYLGPQYVLPWFNKDNRMETEASKRRNEKAIEKIIRLAEKRVRKYLSAHMPQIDVLARTMMKKGFIDSSDMERVMNPSDFALRRSPKRLSANLGAPIAVSHNDYEEFNW